MTAVELPARGVSPVRRLVPWIATPSVVRFRVKGIGALS